MRAHEIRRLFVEFFNTRGHTHVASAPLVPENDPTLLFVNAGMVPFKDVFLGRDKRDYSRAVSVQRCLRAGGKHNDLDNVGFTPRHQTMFEMLGNFSFGDYFKREAIAWAWEFLTKGLGLPAERLVVSVFNGEGEAAGFDEEARELWSEFVPRDRIYAFDAKENFWQMGDTGPCGPCSEIHLFHGDKAPGDALREGKFGPAYQDTLYTELWNLVFMQYEKLADGSLKPLAAPSIDTGAGLERLAAVCAGVPSNFQTDLLAPLVGLAKQLAGADPKADLGERESPFRVIADHARATAFLIADGVFPDKTGRSYVLRRIMRRAIRYGTTVGLDQAFFHTVCDRVVEDFGEVYPELAERRATIAELVQVEEEAFRRTLDRGIRLLDAAIEDLEQGAKEFPAPIAADLYDTYGFPIDLTGVICKEHGLGLEEAEVEQEVARRQSSSQKGALGSDRALDNVYMQLKQAHAGTHEFLGYASETAKATVVALVRGQQTVVEAGPGDEVEIVCDRTPFYGESGGQIGDHGRLTADGLDVEIIDTKKPTGDIHIHVGRVHKGHLKVGQKVELHVDSERRNAIRRNHSATHLLHLALREVLGPHVVQKGSLVAPDRLRFDFSHSRPLTREQLREVEQHVYKAILVNGPASTREMSLADAKKAGAIGLFGEKYGAEVRVVSMGDSVELCGGTHVRRTGDIGLFVIASEEGIAQGVRRIEAKTGSGAMAYVQSLSQTLYEVGGAVHAPTPAEIPGRVEKLQNDLRAKHREVEELQRKIATGGAGASDAPVEVEGIKVLAKVVAVANPKALREAADTLRNRLGSGVVILGAEREGKATLLVALTSDLKKRLHAGKLVGALAAHVKGRGGGRPDLAQAGGPDPSGLPAAIADAANQVQKQLQK